MGRKEIGISWAHCGWGWLVFQSQTGQRWIVTVVSSLSPQHFSPIVVPGVTVSFSLVPCRKREDGGNALFGWWTSETCLSIVTFSVTLAPNFPSFCQSSLLFQGAPSCICDDEITLFLPSIVRTSSNQSCFGFIFLLILSCHLLASLFYFFPLHLHI